MSNYRQYIIATLDSARQIPPAGAAAIFAIAYIAGLLGSVAALFVAAALFVGLFSAARAAEFKCETGAVSTAIVANTQAAELLPAAAVHPSSGACGPSIAEAIAAGLQIRKIEFSGPSPVKVRKVAAPQA